jgi:flagellar protein FliS
MANISSYQQVGAYGSLAEASAYDVIGLMYGTVLTRIAEAKGSIERGEIATKGVQIGKALGIIEGLVLSLDAERGGEIADNLARLYDYMSRSLVKANLNNDIGLLDEVSGLVRELKAGWDELPAEARA